MTLKTTPPLPADLGITDQEWGDTPPRVRLVVLTLHSLVQRLQHLVDDIALLRHQLAKEPDESAENPPAP